MALKSNFDAGRSMIDLNRQKEILYKKVLDAFKYAGESFVVNARGQMQSHAMGTYNDQTTNLRNSIGYFIFFNGKVVGSKNDYMANLSIIQSLNIINQNGFQLVGIAGMNYASHVEAKGYNVISSQADICMVDLTLSLEDLGLRDKGTAALIENTFMP